MLKALWSRLVGGEGAAPAAVAAEVVEYNGCRIRPTPYPAKGGFQTAGVIEKGTGEGTKEHRFVRAETHPTLDEAISFSVAKGKQILDEQGDRAFGPD